ncbi:hypothetical protein PO860_12830 [Rhizobium sp. BJ04]|uniref:hypothetical protein n=1 Tax=Rhizobium binxianense TaxID=3024242 RepID=UPI0023A999AC|nr:hypothetical protein [Rhizobium sp. BJ04]WEA58596.1 hypothetical protein PO860_12830 [Rhizobium sp. BJ04]
MSIEIARRSMLEAMLREDLAAGCLPRGPGGRIARKHYADRLGITKSAMSFYSEVFDQYDQLAGRLDPEEKIIAHVQERSRELIANGELELVNGNVSRTQLLGSLPVYATSLQRRRPRLKKTFEQLDAHVRSIGYVQDASRALLAKLQTALSSGVYDNLETGKLHYRALHAHLGSSGHNLAFPYALRPLIKQHEASLRTRIESDPLVRVRHGKPYSIRPLVEYGWPEETLELLLDSFVAAFEDNQKRKFSQNFNALILVLTLIASNQSAFCRDLMRFIVDRTPNARIGGSVEPFVSLLETHLYRSDWSESNRNHWIDASNAVLALWDRVSILPVSQRLKRSKERRSRSRPTIVELSSSSALTRVNAEEQQARLDGLMAFAADRFNLSDADVAAHFDKEGAAAFFETLRVEFPRIPAEIADDPVQSILYVVNIREAALVEHFVAEFEKWSAIFERGQDLWRDGVDPDSYWNDDLWGPEGRKLVSRIFPNDKSRWDYTLANVLRLVKEKFGGIVPTSTHPDRRICSFFVKRCRFLGGRGFLMAHLFPHKNLIGSAISLYLIESGANIAVGRTLKPMCIHESDQVGYKIVIGNKSKARHKPIVIYLEDDGGAVTAMSWLRDKRSQFLDDDKGVSRDFFFLREKGEAIQPVSENWYLDWFKDQTGNLEFFQSRNVVAVPSSLRPTTMMKAVLDHNGKTRYAITLAQHTESVSPSYYVRLPILFLHEEEHRHYCRILETISLHRLPDGRAFIGVNEAEYAERLEEFEPTGFGTRCRDCLDHPRSPGKTCESFDCWDCDNAILIAEPEEIAPLIQWGEALAAAEGDWMADHPERWQTYFAGWREFIVFVEETMQQPHLVDIWDAARELAARNMADPIYRAYHPWS